MIYMGKNNYSRSNRPGQKKQAEMLGSRLPRDMVQKELARLERSKAYKRLIRNFLISLAMSAAIKIINYFKGDQI